MLNGHPPMIVKVVAEELVGGSASGEILHADVGLSLWGGVDPLTGIVIDVSHPLHKESVVDKILCIPNGRGICHFLKYASSR